MKLRERLNTLRRSNPKHDAATGQLYSAKPQTRLSYKKATLHTVFVSDESTHMMRPHVFESKKRARTPKEWRAWFDKHLEEIFSAGVLPGLAIRTRKQWAVMKVLGWVGDVAHKSNNSAMGRRRNKAKRSRLAHG